MNGKKRYYPLLGFDPRSKKLFPSVENLFLLGFFFHLASGKFIKKKDLAVAHYLLFFFFWWFAWSLGVQVKLTGHCSLQSVKRDLKLVYFPEMKDAGVYRCQFSGWV